MDVLARVVEATDRGDERREARVAFDSPGTATLLETLELLARLAARRRCASPRSRRPAWRSCSDRRFDRGDLVDLTFEDDAGGLVRCRAQVLGAERALYGRTRFAALITAIGELDQLRLDRLVSRCRLQHEARIAQEDDDASVRELLAAARGQRGLRRIVGRAS